MNWIRLSLCAVGVACGLVRPLQAQTNGLFADVATSLGTFSVELDYVRAPRATANFIGLATGARAWRDPESSGIRSNGFYAGTAVHLIRYDDATVPGTTNVLGFQAGLRPGSVVSIARSSTKYATRSVCGGAAVALLRVLSVGPRLPALGRARETDAILRGRALRCCKQPQARPSTAQHKPNPRSTSKPRRAAQQGPGTSQTEPGSACNPV